MTQVVVTIGGGELSPRGLELVEDDAVVIAADSGLDHAVRPGPGARSRSSATWTASAPAAGCGPTPTR